VLELRNVTLSIRQDGEIKPLLADISAIFPRGHFAAILGPSGCGKSTLLKVITGIAHGKEEGEIYWDGRDLMHHDFSPSEIGYVPQFSITHEDLTVRESVSYSIKLRVRGMSGDALDEATIRILDEVNMTEFAGRLVRVLSGGQKRRLALAMELASKPAMLLCDEVTSGLDPQSEDEIVTLLHGLSRSDGRTVISVTHSVRHLGFYDSVLVLYQGIGAYQGPPESLTHYFRCEDPQDLYSQLVRHDAAAWAQSWKKHRRPFEEAMSGQVPDHLESLNFESPPDDPEIEFEAPPEPERAKSLPQPSAFSQFRTLTARRFRIFSRNRTQLFLQLGLIFGFPILVAIFALNGLPAVQNLSMGMDLNVVKQLQESMSFLVQASKIGSLVSGIVMFKSFFLPSWEQITRARDRCGAPCLREGKALRSQAIELCRQQGSFSHDAGGRPIAMDGAFCPFRLRLPRRTGRSTPLPLACKRRNDLRLPCYLQHDGLGRAGVARLDLLGRLPTSALRCGPRAAGMGRNPRPSFHRRILELVRCFANAEG
jgi:ABC-type multidrug transport system ATPase subunit